MSRGLYTGALSALLVIGEDDVTAWPRFHFSAHKQIISASCTRSRDGSQHSRESQRFTLNAGQWTPTILLCSFDNLPDDIIVLSCRLLAALGAVVSGSLYILWAKPGCCAPGPAWQRVCIIAALRVAHFHIQKLFVLFNDSVLICSIVLHFVSFVSLARTRTEWRTTFSYASPNQYNSWTVLFFRYRYLLKCNH